MGLWAPYAGSETYYFSFKIYERSLHDGYPDAPIAEQNLTVQKDKDALGVGACATLTVTAPPDPAIYIYRVVVQGAWDYEVEFPILVER